MAVYAPRHLGSSQDLCVVWKDTSEPAPPPKSVLPLKVIEPFEKWDLNIIGSLIKDRLGKKYIITAIDYFTRWPVAWETTNHTATTITVRKPGIGRGIGWLGTEHSRARG
ncbi:hypothetical protein DSO57_1004152 [Entomophthora muscae]|uniref:Uncharacterized protein n=1 Tax=Entomophthora muscae TaxID=34485 RepID=A0ACC2UHY9_9FUNG|nr:hypothetical protein DSO57_1004152 [Entomophthora muscae]